MEKADEITRRRLALWGTYHQWLEALETSGKIRRPIPRECVHNAHMYYILLPSLEVCTALIDELKRHDVHAVFHYVPLHSALPESSMGRRWGRIGRLKWCASRRS
ncbi:MAG TPA: DegT/DnrJ/EryC1/StrS family aminotransferase [Gammaproteobacteria bacterium]|nr:DegT/DnrJ/EryC1/StrS family aminotransferase [Gammaproteobacteria bacterium]